MASFLSKLFGSFGGSGNGTPAPAGKTETYGDCLIHARPIREGNQYRLAGSIEKTDNGTVKVRTFIRADVFASEEDTLDATLRKARQIIDQHGPSLFADEAESRQV